MIEVQTKMLDLIAQVSIPEHTEPVIAMVLWSNWDFGCYVE